MPTVLVYDGFQVCILLPPREHGPPHVHVRRAGAKVVVLLPADGSSTRIRRVLGMRDADVVAAFRLVEAHADFQLAEWRRLHG